MHLICVELFQRYTSLNNGYINYMPFMHIHYTNTGSPQSHAGNVSHKLLRAVALREQSQRECQLVVTDWQGPNKPSSGNPDAIVGEKFRIV